MTAIVTKYLGASNTRGARITARAMGHWVTVPYDHSSGSEANHRRAADALVKKMAWEFAGKMISGELEHGYVFVFEKFGRESF